MSDGPSSSTPAPVADDPSIPLLTDRIYLPAVDLDTALPASLAPLPAAVPEAAAEAEQQAAIESPSPAGPQDAVAIADAPAGEAARADEAGVEPPIEVEVELDRDLVAASDADFDALLSAEPQVATADYVAAGDETALEARAEALRESVLQRVMERLPEQVNATVRDLMQPAIEQAMARLGDEAGLALRIALQELVEQALREELAQRPGPPRS
jgi:hypothetical protein